MIVPLISLSNGLLVGTMTLKTVWYNANALKSHRDLKKSGNFPSERRHGYGLCRLQGLKLIYIFPLTLITLSIYHHAAVRA